MSHSEPFVSSDSLFKDNYQEVVALMATHSPFPRGQSEAFSLTAKLRAARIHLEEAVFFGQVAYRALAPLKTVELCAGFGVPSITIAKLFGRSAVCVDSDQAKMELGAKLCGYLGIQIQWESADIFAFLRRNAEALKGTAILATAAYCHDRKFGKPRGSGERDIVHFAMSHRLNLALLPFRTGDIIHKGISSESARIAQYEELLTKAGYHVERHSTAPLFRGQQAPEWFFIDLLTARHLG
jgi:hypothetical protein